jgi:hypothetical protein
MLGSGGWINTEPSVLAAGRESNVKQAGGSRGERLRLTEKVIFINPVVGCHWHSPENEA